MVNYACHCTTLDPADNLVSGDWAGYAQEAIEDDHPGAIALTLIGCGADANPQGPARPRRRPRHGRAIADEVNRLLKGPLDPVARAPRRQAPAGSSSPSTPCRPARSSRSPGRGRRAARATTPRPSSPGSTAASRSRPSCDYSVQTWQFGDDLVMVFLAGEVVVDYVLRLKNEFDPARLWVVAYANDVPCYIPSERILREGGYEGGGAMVYYGRPTRLKPGIEDRIVEAVREIVPASFAAKR